MKLLDFADEHLKMLNDLCHVALKGAGIEAFQLVKKVSDWVSSAKDKVESSVGKVEQFCKKEENEQ